MSSVYDATCLRLARFVAPAVLADDPIEPILRSIDPRRLVVGDVFLWDGKEVTVEWTNWQPINCRLEVHTNRGHKLLFTRDSDNVTTVL